MRKLLWKRQRICHKTDYVMLRTQDYISCNSIINATDVCQTLLQLHTKMKNKCHSLNSIILKHGNAQTYMAHRCQGQLNVMTWEVLKHPTCSKSSSPLSIIKWVSIEHTSYNIKPVSTNPRSATTD